MSYLHIRANGILDQIMRMKALFARDQYYLWTPPTSVFPAHLHGLTYVCILLEFLTFFLWYDIKAPQQGFNKAKMTAKEKNRHWAQKEKNLIAVWGKLLHLKQVVHSHTVCESLYKILLLLCPSVQDCGDWTKTKERFWNLHLKCCQNITL